MVVCTHNRRDLLLKCYESLINQSENGKAYEIVIVDNSSTDGTGELVCNWLNQTTPVVYVFEAKLGLSYARNRGWQTAQGAYVAYIDDDAIANSDWLKRMSDFIDKHPNVAAFGGPFDGFADAEVPDWFPSEYGSFSLGNEDKLIDVRTSCLCGGNFVVRKDIFFKCGGFNPELGMKGNVVSYGEETRFFIDIADAGYDIYYVSEMRIKHLIADYKLSLLWLLKAEFAAGKIVATSYASKPNLVDSLNVFLFSCLKFVKTLFRLEPMPFKRRLYYSLKDMYKAIGMNVTYFQ